MSSVVRALARERAVRWSPWRVRRAAAAWPQAPAVAALQVRLHRELQMRLQVPLPRRVPARARRAQTLPGRAQR